MEQRYYAPSYYKLLCIVYLSAKEGLCAIFCLVKEEPFMAMGNYAELMIKCFPKSWDMGSAERRKVNVLETKCLGSLVGVSMNKVRNEEVHRRAGIERE